MLEKIVSKASYVIVKATDETGKVIVRIVKNDLTRSPEKDCFASVPDGLSNVIKSPAANTEMTQNSQKKELRIFLKELEDKIGKPRFNKHETETVVSNANTPEQVHLVKELTQIKKLSYVNIASILNKTKKPELALLKSDLVEKLIKTKSLDEENLEDILLNANTAEQVCLAGELVQIKKLTSHGCIGSIIRYVDTPEKASIKADLADKLAKMKNYSGENIAYIINNANTPEQAHLAEELAPIGKFRNVLANILYHAKTPERIQLASNLSKIKELKGETFETLVRFAQTHGQIQLTDELTHVEKLSCEEIPNIVSAANTPERIQLAEKLIKNEKVNNEQLPSIIYAAKTPEKAELMENLANNEKFDGAQIVGLGYYAQTQEQIKLLNKLIQADRFSGDGIENIIHFSKKTGQLKLANELTSIERLSYEHICKLLLNVTRKSGQGFIKADLAKKLAPNERFNEFNLSSIIFDVETSEHAESIGKLLEDSSFVAKFDTLEQPLGNSLLSTSLRGNIDPEQFDFKRISNLYKFMSENKTILQQFGEEKNDAECVANLFSPNMIKSLDILDDGVVKYAMKLKYDGFRGFIDNTATLKNKLDSGNYSLLKENLTKLTMPEQKMEKTQCIGAMVNYSFSESDIKEGINLIKSPKTTVSQISEADKIFTSDKPYSKQIQEFLTKFNVSAERQDKIVAFLEKNKLNEKVTIDNKTKTKTLSSNAKQELAQQIEAHINIINSNKELNNFINSKIYEKLGIEPTPELSENLNFDKRYLPKLFSAVSNSKFSNEFKKLIELVKTNPSKPLSELREVLPQNQQTKQLFKENGINYGKWTNFDENSFKSFSFETNVKEAVKSVEKNIIKELNGDLFKSVEKKQTDKILVALTDEGYKIDAEKITKNGEAVGQKDLERIVDVFKETINENNEFWDKPLANAKQESLKNELIDHLLKGRKKEVADLAQISDEKMDLAVRLSDDNDIGRNIFLGNHVGCCTSVDGCNNFAAPQHLMNSFVRAVEIVDKSGNSYGNSMCYFAKVDDKLSFIIDSCEANGKLGGNVAVTDAIVDYAKQVTKEMGKPGIPIYFGPNYNKINIDKLKKTSNHTVEVIGRVDEQTYIDAIGGHSDVNVAHSGRDLFKIK